ncbi:DUF1963 domain-containing protein [Bradyrhizobium sp.]|uniref:DUF1963 domain-containing protein n=1 Tax=Bradyrhizobium sp. TaxID=376 RepID=UPI0039E6ACB3
MVLSVRDEIEETARPAVLVRRSDLPVPLSHPARSFFGGLPKLPPQFEWPKAEVKAHEVLETVALTFVAQIDLAEVPDAKWSPLPKRGTLYFFCSSVFEGEAFPPCRVIYSDTAGDAYADRAPPPDLMPLAGTSGGFRVKWLDPALDFHSKVEFKYPLSFLPYRDFLFLEDEAVAGELTIEELCKALGPGEPEQRDLLQFRSLSEYEKDEHWPFNWLLVTYVVRAVLWHVEHDLTPGSHYRPLTDETVVELTRLRAGAIEWFERCRAPIPMDRVDTDTKAIFRSWWLDVARAYKEMHGRTATYPGQMPTDLGNAINHTIRYMAIEDADLLDDVPLSYVVNLERQNRWMTPTGTDGQHRFFSIALHQMLGYGSSPPVRTRSIRRTYRCSRCMAISLFLIGTPTSGASFNFGSIRMLSRSSTLRRLSPRSNATSVMSAL